jgi:hypothetical protein
VLVLENLSQRVSFLTNQPDLKIHSLLFCGER